MALAGVSWLLPAAVAVVAVAVAVAVDAAGFDTAGSGVAVGVAADIGADIVDTVDTDSARIVHNHTGHSHILLQHLRNIPAVLHIASMHFRE